MGVYDTRKLSELLLTNSYPGRGITVGTSSDGKSAVLAYFIMGRSENSRNRIFVEKENGEIITEAYDESKLIDPSLIIYSPVKTLDQYVIVSNGDQTDTVYDALNCGESFESALGTRCFEPDAPNYTPRISALLDFTNGFSYMMSILKSTDETGSGCARYFYSYPSISGLGHLIHTYQRDGSPLPSFVGEPHRVSIPNDPNELADTLWESLDPQNRISLYVRYIDINNMSSESVLINNKRAAKL